MVCVRLIIGEGGERERDERSVDRLIQNNLDGREGTAVLGTKRGRSRRLPTPPTPREVASLHSDYNPTTQATIPTNNPTTQKAIYKRCRNTSDPTPAKPHGRQPLETPQYTLVHYSTIYSLLYTAQYTLVHSSSLLLHGFPRKI